MAIKDILLPLVGEPDAAAIAAIEKCMAVAGDIGARVTAIAVEEEIVVRPTVMIAADLADVGLAEAVRSVTDAGGLLRATDLAAVRFGVGCDHQLIRLSPLDIAERFVQAARLKDLSIVPLKSGSNQSQDIIERLIFESGRPILICPERLAGELRVAFDRVVIAWDHTAQAASAVADALPMLQAAASVAIVTAVDDPTAAQLSSGAALVGHLAKHGIRASFETLDVDGSSVGKVLEAFVNRKASDLLVMGAYRHSRLAESLWGGATKTVIGQPPCWVMMSH